MTEEHRNRKCGHSPQLSTFLEFRVPALIWNGASRIPVKYSQLVSQEMTSQILPEVYHLGLTIVFKSSQGDNEDQSSQGA